MFPLSLFLERIMSLFVSSHYKVGCHCPRSLSLFVVIVPAENIVLVRVLSPQGGLFSPVTVRHCFCRGLCPCLFPFTTGWVVLSSSILVPVCCHCSCRGECPVCVHGGLLCPLLFLFRNCLLLSLFLLRIVSHFVFSHYKVGCYVLPCPCPCLFAVTVPAADVPLFVSSPYKMGGSIHIYPCLFLGLKHYGIDRHNTE